MNKEQVQKGHIVNDFILILVSNSFEVFALM